MYLCSLMLKMKENTEGNVNDDSRFTLVLPLTRFLTTVLFEKIYRCKDGRESSSIHNMDTSGYFVPMGVVFYVRVETIKYGVLQRSEHDDRK